MTSFRGAPASLSRSSFFLSSAVQRLGLIAFESPISLWRQRRNCFSIIAKVRSGTSFAIALLLAPLRYSFTTSSRSSAVQGFGGRLDVCRFRPAGTCVATGGAAASCSIKHDVEIRRIQDGVEAIVLRDGRQRMELRSFIFAGVWLKLMSRENRVCKCYAVLFLQVAYQTLCMAADISRMIIFDVEGWGFEV